MTAAMKKWIGAITALVVVAGLPSADAANPRNRSKVGCPTQAAARQARVSTISAVRRLKRNPRRGSVAFMGSTKTGSGVHPMSYGDTSNLGSSPLKS